MTVKDYTLPRSTADRLLTKFGQSVSIRRITTSGPAWEPTQTAVDYATTAAIVDYTARQIDGENILITDRRALVAAGPLITQGVTSVAPPDTLVVGGVAVPIVRVTPINPAGVTVLYDCQLRF